MGKPLKRTYWCWRNLKLSLKFPGIFLIPCIMNFNIRNPEYDDLHLETSWIKLKETGGI